MDKSFFSASDGHRDVAIGKVAKAYDLPLGKGGQDQRVEEALHQAYLSGQNYAAEAFTVQANTQAECLALAVELMAQTPPAIGNDAAVRARATTEAADVFIEWLKAKDESQGGSW